MKLDLELTLAIEALDCVEGHGLTERPRLRSIYVVQKVGMNCDSLLTDCTFHLQCHGALQLASLTPSGIL